MAGIALVPCSEVRAVSSGDLEEAEIGDLGEPEIKVSSVSNMIEVNLPCLLPAQLLCSFAGTVMAPAGGIK